jgi:glucosamine 6-phosphate synthetase-like amidotransferase/phosphosugar isomerase protein
MCGIVAAAASRNIVNVLIEGLKKLEYRGYVFTSDASALLQVTRNMVYLENGDIAELTATQLRIANANGESVQRPVHVSELSAAAVELGEYQHYMQKEIFEQPQALGNTLEMIGGSKSIQSGIFGADAAELLADIDSILILACGTSGHAGLTARYWLESIAGVRCNVEIASEYRYRVSVPNPRQLIVAISQSGETADTLAALFLGRGRHSLPHRPRRCAQAESNRSQRWYSCHETARTLRPAIAHPARRRAATAVVPRGTGEGYGCG